MAQIFPKGLETNLSVGGFTPEKLPAPLTVFCDFRYLQVNRQWSQDILTITQPILHQINLMLMRKSGIKSLTDSIGFWHQHLAPSVGKRYEKPNFYLYHSEGRILSCTNQSKFYFSFESTKENPINR